MNRSGKTLELCCTFKRGCVSRRRDIYNSLPRNYGYYNSVYISCTYNNIDSLMADTSRVVQQFGSPTNPTG